MKLHQKSLPSIIRLNHLRCASVVRCPFIPPLHCTKGENISSLVNRVCWLLWNVTSETWLQKTKLPVTANLRDNCKERGTGRNLEWRTEHCVRRPLGAACCRHPKILSSWMQSKSCATATLSCRLGLHAIIMACRKRKKKTLLQAVILLRRGQNVLFQ